MAVQLTVSVGVKQSLMYFLINHLRLYREISYKASTANAINSNNYRLERFLKMPKESLFWRWSTPKRPRDASPDVQAKGTTYKEEIIDVDSEDGRLRSARKRTEKELFDPSRGKTKIGSTPNDNLKTVTRYSSTTQNTSSSVSQTITVLEKVLIEKPDNNNDGLFADRLPQNPLPIFEPVMRKFKLSRNLLFNVNIGPLFLSRKSSVQWPLFLRSPLCP